MERYETPDGHGAQSGRGMPEARETTRLAVLIDGDNTSARHAQAIFDEIVKLGEATVRRIYGDFSHGRLSGWDGRSSRLRSCSTSSAATLGGRTRPTSRWS